MVSRPHVTKLKFVTKSKFYDTSLGLKSDLYRNFVSIIYRYRICIGGKMTLNLIRSIKIQFFFSKTRMTKNECLLSVGFTTRDRLRAPEINTSVLKT